MEIIAFYDMMLGAVGMVCSTALPPTITRKLRNEIIGWAKSHYETTAQLLGVDTSPLPPDLFAIAIGQLVDQRIKQ